MLVGPPALTLGRARSVPAAEGPSHLAAELLADRVTRQPRPRTIAQSGTAVRSVWLGSDDHYLAPREARQVGAMASEEVGCVDHDEVGAIGRDRCSQRHAGAHRLGRPATMLSIEQFDDQVASNRMCHSNEHSGPADTDRAVICTRNRVSSCGLVHHARQPARASIRSMSRSCCSSRPVYAPERIICHIGSLFISWSIAGEALARIWSIIA